MCLIVVTPNTTHTLNDPCYKYLIQVSWKKTFYCTVYWIYSQCTKALTVLLLRTRHAAIVCCVVGNSFAVQLKATKFSPLKLHCLWYVIYQMCVSACAYVAVWLNMLLLMMANKNINCGVLILQIIARHKAAGAAAVATAAKQDPVQHQTTASGEKYPLPNKPSAKQQGVSVCMHVHTHVCTYIRRYKSAIP